MKVRRIIDLSYPITEGMPVFPGDPMPEFVKLSDMKEKSYRLTKIILGSHTGTHVDAPSHMVDAGNPLDEIPLEKLMGEAVVLDLTHVKLGEAVTSSDLRQHEVKEGDIALLFTGMSGRWGDERYLTNYTYLSPEAAEWLVEKKVKVVGTDWSSIEKYGGTRHPAHVKLFSHNIPVIESLANLDMVKGRRIFFICLPLSLKGLDGSPARALAIDFEA